MSIEYQVYNDMPKYEHWTPSAVDCYNRGCKCNGCLMQEILGNRCRMKKSVLYLVRTLGVPKNGK